MTGLQNGMVMQRNAQGECAMILAGGDLPQAVFYAGAATGSARLEPLADGTVQLTGIPVGGPYAVMADDRVFTDIYVGDVWLLAGQSNMEGVGWLTEKDRAFPGRESVRAFCMDDVWRPARHPMHKPWTALDKVHTAVLGFTQPNPPYRGVGPGLAFGQRMEAITGVPQGLICCAHGGTSMKQWDPALKEQGGDKSLYGAMLRRFRATGCHVRGLFWYQGCSDAMQRAGDMFTARTAAFIRECRKDFGEELPVVQVQLARVVNVSKAVQDPLWSDIREQQRRLSESIPHLHTVSTIGKTLDEAIHISAAAQQELGDEAAEAMANLLYGDESGFLPPPTFTGWKLHDDGISGAAVVEALYTNLHGGLAAPGRAAGFALSCSDAAPYDTPIVRVDLNGGRALIHCARRPEELRGWKLWYGYGTDPFCNITDEAGRDLPAMGPVPLE